MATSIYIQRVIVLVTCLLLSTPLMAQSSARDLFEDGNRLFRDDLYWAALLRYSQASERGLDTPVLHYNTGIAHYKAQQHRRARIELEKAARSSRLAPLAHYNLGLNAWRAGSRSEALRWFRLARDQQQNARISSLARRAISRLRAAQREADPVTVRAENRRRKEEKKPGKLDIYASVGFGNDSNIYRSPSESYIDFAQAGQPTVDPTVTSGAYMPVNLRLRYKINAFMFENFYGQYRLRGRVFQDKELDNASEYAHEISFGSSYKREENGRKAEIYSAFKIAQSEETYFDPDFGTERVVNGVEIGDRLNYRSYGPELRFRVGGEKFSVGGIVEGYLRNYEDVEVVPEYDHEYFKLGVHTQYKFTRSSLLRIDLEAFSRRYGDRPSFDLDGQQRLGNPGVEYEYLDFSLIARQRLFDSFWFGLEYQFTDRTDAYVGYNDYTRNSFKVEAHWTPSRRLKINGYGRYSLYDYPNAFAFNDPNLNAKTLETASGGVKAKWKLTRRLSLVGDLRFRETVSNDTRIQYDRNQFMVSVLWEQ